MPSTHLKQISTNICTCRSIPVCEVLLTGPLQPAAASLYLLQCSTAMYNADLHPKHTLQPLLQKSFKNTSLLTRRYSIHCTIPHICHRCQDFPIIDFGNPPPLPLCSVLHCCEVHASCNVTTCTICHTCFLWFFFMAGHLPVEQPGERFWTLCSQCAAPSAGGIHNQPLPPNPLPPLAVSIIKFCAHLLIIWSPCLL